MEPCWVIFYPSQPQSPVLAQSQKTNQRQHTRRAAQTQQTSKAKPIKLYKTSQTAHNKQTNKKPTTKGNTNNKKDQQNQTTHKNDQLRNQKKSPPSKPGRASQSRCVSRPWPQGAATKATRPRRRRYPTQGTSSAGEISTPSSRKVPGDPATKIC